MVGRILVIGGVGYVLSAFLAYGLSGAPEWLVEGLTYPASLGEFWMIGYLLIVGIRLVGADRSQVSLVSA